MSRDEFADFYSASFARVSAAVRAFCGDADVAYEATQEAFARAYARWPRLKEAGWAHGWVTTTALNLSRRHFRLRARRPPPGQDTSSPGPTTDRLDVLAALRSLPERQRQAVVLHYLVDCPVATVADLMGLSEGTVKAHLHKARATLHDLLEIRHA
ncbi:MAG: sigma-70 family RNA polymerase sigma factor [Actinomycetota bacterium]|nr:sigma-70 family RNA polymerase sigma factor [Actinomycetota bacterium]